MHQIFSCLGWVRGYCHYSYSLFGFSAWINFVSRKHLPFNKLHQDAKSQCRNEKYLWWNTRNEEKTPTHTKLFRIRKLSIDLNVTILTFSVFHFFDFDDILKWDKISHCLQQCHVQVLPFQIKCARFFHIYGSCHCWLVGIDEENSFSASLTMTCIEIYLVWLTFYVYAEYTSFSVLFFSVAFNEYVAEGMNEEYSSRHLNRNHFVSLRNYDKTSTRRCVFNEFSAALSFFT